jgi:hypothetical protein
VARAVLRNLPYGSPQPSDAATYSMRRDASRLFGGHDRTCTIHWKDNDDAAVALIEIPTPSLP